MWANANGNWENYGTCGLTNSTIQPANCGCNQQKPIKHMAVGQVVGYPKSLARLPEKGESYPSGRLAPPNPRVYHP
jgi:hypothetical protein